MEVFIFGGMGMYPIYSDMHMYSYTSKETVHKYHFWNSLKGSKLEATDFNFFSFIYIDVKGFSFKFGQKIFIGLEMPDQERYAATLFQYFTT